MRASDTARSRTLKALRSTFRDAIRRSWRRFRRLERAAIRPRLRRFAITLLKVRLSPRSAARHPDQRTAIRILLLNAYAMGGTTRTVLNQAGYLARHHNVEIISLLRRREKPFFPFPPGVTVSVLDDRTRRPCRLGRLLSRLPSLLTPQEEASFRSVSLWTDVWLARRIRGMRSGVLMATRPSLNLLTAEIARPRVVTIGQDHMNLGSYREQIRREIVRRYGRLTALTVLTPASLTEYREALAGQPVRVARIPNALPNVDGGATRGDSKVMVAAGRLTRQKGFDLLIRAFVEVSEKHPDWVLRIFGSGHLENKLKKMIAKHGLTGKVILNARTRRLGHELADASVYVLSSRFEGMPMVLIEAMSKGLAVVSFDCPHGPAELITHLSDGLLVPPKDVAKLSAALLQTIEDENLRRQLGHQAKESARAYDLEVIGAQWDRLLAELRR